MLFISSSRFALAPIKSTEITTSINTMLAGFAFFFIEFALSLGVMIGSFLA
jgi:hypothetical protein